jgi:hypothetical protein
MAGTKSDFVIYQDQFHGGMVDKLTQEINLFNSSTNNAIRLDVEDLLGEYNRETFFKRVANLISRRDNTSTSAVASLKMETDEYVGIKLNRKVGPVDQTLDAWKKVGKSPQEMSFILGQLYAEESMKEMLDTGLRSLIAAITTYGAGTGYIDSTTASTTTLNTTKLVSGLGLFGDQRSNIVCFVGHSKPAVDLTSSQITDNILNVSGSVVRSASSITLNRPFLETDSAVLEDTGNYYTLGLVEGAVRIKQSEAPTVVTEIVTGYENLIGRFQGDYAYSVEIEGHKWDFTNGGVNPNDTALGTSTNWDKAGQASVKTGPGFYLLTK